jgi:hypothetical protein
VNSVRKKTPREFLDPIYKDLWIYRIFFAKAKSWIGMICLEKHYAKLCATSWKNFVKPRAKNFVNSVQNSVKRRAKLCETPCEKNTVKRRAKKTKKGLPPIQKAAHRGRVCLNSNSKNNILKTIYVILPQR